MQQRNPEFFDHLLILVRFFINGLSFNPDNNLGILAIGLANPLIPRRLGLYAYFLPIDFIVVPFRFFSLGNVDVGKKNGIDILPVVGGTNVVDVVVHVSVFVLSTGLNVVLCAWNVLCV